MFNHQPPFFVLFSCIQVLLSLDSASGCPSFCACKWKNGKQTVNCSGKSLADIPNDLDPSTQVLEFNSNTLKSLPAELFKTKQLVNLQRIYMTHCKIKLINEKTFNGLSNLVELDLSHNSLETVPTASFIDCPSLMRLSLSYNPIRVLKKLAFNHLTFLNTLELTGCELVNVDEEAFRSLHSLEWLMLDGNKLKTVRGATTLPENLKGVRLHGNAWECDCHIKDLHSWLKNFKVPTSEEPSCSGPARLAGRYVKSMAASELACLPDVSPTTFYLELAEGKNVSLLCHVHAVPEAAVSWWFQGQVLQNNSAVAPGIHLVYFVEEGAENKRSELFIYNANSEDNGTFMCNAENAAGVVQSNFTIRVIIKEDPVVIIVSFPFEYLVAGVAVTTILALLVIVLLTMSIMRCRRRRRRMMKREKTKDVTLHYQQQQQQQHQQQDQQQQQPQQQQQQQNMMTMSKFDAAELAPSAPPSRVVGYEELHAAAGVAVTSAATAEMNSYVTVRTRGDELLSAITAANQVGSPASLRRYQLEQNPDLINGTESMLGCEAGGELKPRAAGAASPPVVRQGFAQIPVACLRTNPRIYSDVRWDACLVDADGYPIDYGLPKAAPAVVGRVPENYYRTLPSNRMRRQSAVNPRTRYSQEAEFLATRNCISPPYDIYHTDVRYTADGYPVAPPCASVNATTDGAPLSEASAADAVSSLPCCSVQWPACVPANMHTITAKEPEYVRKVVTKRCVGAQTDTAAAPPAAAKVESQDESVINEVLTESPDEGYEGEPSVV